MVVKLFVKYTIMPLMQKLLNAFPSGLLKLRLGLRDQNLQYIEEQKNALSFKQRPTVKTCTMLLRRVTSIIYVKDKVIGVN
ncbi:hypothetical protein X777_01163 [Ooceraea biroi]|uniref:Uncharacterized protein n=1 Tax=Ooceraea biroi TaxID=2015173 RepID=A0A026X3J7_OOCBI|nr:hypothetical protein X777_01163 [Ooceraea biroi]